ncbi:MAG: MBL fold metallo-hydrolase [Calditrichaeota bacterium]|nr:MBL fold metallo-hydrolase [Calditrichota bacterium]MCB9472445.1 MBL fold metallo-hydrolase [Candidatus Delongbacteria bacterium]
MNRAPIPLQTRLDLDRSELEICVLASGSKGNSLVLRTHQGCLLVDAGLSARELLRRLSMVGVPATDLAGVLLSHAHSDHSSGLGVLCRKLGLPVFTSAGTQSACARHLTGHGRLHTIRAGQPFQVLGLDILPFAVSHDCREPLMFRVEAGQTRLAIATDLGVADPGVSQHLHGLDLLVLESNHDLERLLAGPYPWQLKQRVRGPRGHLSNRQAAELLCEVLGPRLKHVILGHLSDTNNTPALALETVRSLLRERGLVQPELRVAAQSEPGEWLRPGADRLPASKQANS